jgi:type I restriction enzyme M protein
MLLESDIQNPIFGDEQASFRWSKFKNLDPQVMFDLVKDQVFPFIKNVNGEDSAFAKHMSDAIFMIPKAAVLDRVVNMIDKIDMNDRDTKGDLYEYMLSKLQNSGTNGQFRTPRHIIKMMVHMTKPKLGGVGGGDTICDPASGTCGFLMAAEEYVRQRFEQELLKPANSTHFHNSMFNAYDFDQHMLRIGAMNLMLHGVEQPTVEYRDSLSDHGYNNISDKYSLILANPPFKGSVAFDELSPDLLSALGKTPKKAAAKKAEKDDEGNTKQKKPPSEKTELLFLALILRMLQPGGRAAVIVPDGVLFGATKSHNAIREKIVAGHKLDAVVSLPTGVFKPYAGVSTAILFFTKTNSGGTDKVWFYDMQADGFSLDDKRIPLIKDVELTTEADILPSQLDDENQPSEHDNHKLNNIPDVLYRWNNNEDEQQRKRTEQSFYVPLDEIVKNDYDLSINRYKEVVYEEVTYDEPKVIIKRIKALQAAMDKGICELEGML